MTEIPEGVETYIGDGVYVSHDGYQLWLRTGAGDTDTVQHIALEPMVFQELLSYAARFGTYFFDRLPR